VINTTEVLTALVIAALLSTGGWIWLQFIASGKLFLKRLGTIDTAAAEPANRAKGVRATFALAALASALATGTLVALLVWKPTPPSLTIETFPPEQPAYLGPQKDGYFYTEKNDRQQLSERTFDMCGVSYISGDGNGQCGVSASKDSSWSIQISGKRYCKVTCLKYGTR